MEIIDIKKELDAMKVPELKKILHSHGISPNGRKDALVKRIMTLNLYPQKSADDGAMEGFT